MHSLDIYWKSRVLERVPSCSDLFGNMLTGFLDNEKGHRCKGRQLQCHRAAESAPK